ncbi:MAG: hypothetical protein RRA15_13900, partial [bacterium]|nr:hypothetical protein [bacterium]
LGFPYLCHHFVLFLNHQNTPLDTTITYVLILPADTFDCNGVGGDPRGIFGEFLLSNGKVCKGLQKCKFERGNKSPLGKEPLNLYQEMDLLFRGWGGHDFPLSFC